MRRRQFLKILGLGGVAGAALPGAAGAAPFAYDGSPDAVGVLHDSVRCIGCRKCAKFAPDKFTVNGFLAAVNYQAEAFPTAEDVSAVGCPTGALLTVEEHLKIEQNEPEWSAGKK